MVSKKIFFTFQQEDQAAAEVLEDFVSSFDNSGGKSMAKMFVKGAVINPLSKDDKDTPDKGVLYKPALKLIGKSASAAASSVSKSLLAPSPLPSWNFLRKN